MEDYNKLYYLKNKDKFLEKVICECGERIGKHHLVHHLRTDRHRRTLNNIKKCSYCHVEKNLDEFYKSKNTHDRHSYVCIVCKKKEMLTKVKCICGCEVIRIYLNNHMKRDVHRLNMESKNL